MPVSDVALRVHFFDYLFADAEGFLCIATSSPTAPDTTFKHHYFEWPYARPDVAEFIAQWKDQNHVWFCVSLLKDQQAIKENCLPGSFIWADLDLVSPGDLQAHSVPAQCVVETSPGKYQAFWRLDKVLPPDIREDYSKRMTYYVGADKGGWACNKLMRVPLTKNFKYADRPPVELLFANETLMPINLLEGLPEPPLNPTDVKPIDMPDITKLAPADNIIYKYSYQLHGTAFSNLYLEEPNLDQDWSNRMWRLLNVLFEQGLDREEVFSLSIKAACNKYARDNRPISYLWREVLKAESLKLRTVTLLGEYKPLIMPELVDPDMDVENFIMDYKQYGISVTDAVPEYHELCAFMLLSGILSAGLQLKASFGRMIPNIWGLVLGDSTLTRKTTAMEMAMSFLRDVDQDAVVATDGSPEGLISALSDRSERVSIYYKDEISGLFAAMNSKSYLSDMPEILTKMYDVPEYYSRPLRKETITIRSPYFIFFGGGIRDKVYSLLNEDYVLSGFLPRFLVVNGDADLSKLRPTGPPNEETSTAKDALNDRIVAMYDNYSMTVRSKLGTQSVMIPQNVEATLTQDAWDFFAEIETKLTHAASDSALAMLALPTFTRLAFSTLKMGVLLAGARGPDHARRVIVSKQDLQEAAWFTQRWGKHSIALLQNAGVSRSERWIERIIGFVKRHPGCTRTQLMQGHRVSSKEMTELLQTITDRGMVDVKRSGSGRTLSFYPIETV